LQQQYYGVAVEAGLVLPAVTIMKRTTARLAVQLVGVELEGGQELRAGDVWHAADAQCSSNGGADVAAASLPVDTVSMWLPRN
jgi:hypothetical protein